MIKHLLLLLFAAFATHCQAQTPYVQWQQCYGGTLGDYAESIIQTADSGYVMAANAASADDEVTGNHGGGDYWIVKLTSAGALVWQKTFGGTGGDNVQNIQQTADGGFIVAGVSSSTDGDVTGNHGFYDYWIIKLSATGSLVWEKSFGGSGADFCHYVRQTTDGGYIIAGESNSTDGDVTGNHGGFDVWIVKLTATGALSWQKSLGGSGDDNGAAVVQTADGGYLVSANTASHDGDISFNHGGDDNWIIKLSSVGNIEWQKTFGGSGMDDLTDEFGAGALQQTTDGGFIFTGWSNSTDGDITGNHGSYDYWVVKIDDTGRLQWERSLGGTGDDEATSIEQTADGGYVLAGLAQSNDGDVSGNHGGDDYWIVKIDDTGHIQWQKCLGGTGYLPNDCANAVHQAMGGGYIVAGYTNANDFDVSGNHGSYDAWVVRLNCIVPSAGTLTGPSKVCIGSTINLADTASGGVWSTTNIHAAVSGGTVTGSSAGVDTIKYTVSNSCAAGIATQVVTVNPLPVPIITRSGVTLTAASGYTSYQWLLNGTVISGATNASYNESASGVYAVTVTDTNGCSGTSATDTVHNVGVSLLYATPVSIFPNPASDYIMINGIAQPHAKLYNMLGQLEMEATGNKLEISALPPGVYQLIISDNAGMQVLREKIIKQ